MPEDITGSGTPYRSGTRTVEFWFFLVVVVSLKILILQVLDGMAPESLHYLMIFCHHLVCQSSACLLYNKDVWRGGETREDISPCCTMYPNMSYLCPYTSGTSNLHKE